MYRYFSESKPLETFVFDDLSSKKKDDSRKDKYGFEKNNYQEDKMEVDVDRKINSNRMDQPALPCTELEYDQLKSNLMQYHCARIGEPDCSSDSPSSYSSTYSMDSKFYVHF